MLLTNAVWIGIGSNIVLQYGRPVSDSAPSEVPWYASRREIALRRAG